MDGRTQVSANTATRAEATTTRPIISNAVTSTFFFVLTKGRDCRRKWHLPVEGCEFEDIG